MTYYGGDNKNPKRKWTDETLVEYLKNLIENGEEIHSKAVKRNHAGFEYGVRKVFGTYRGIFEAIGMDYDSIRKGDPKECVPWTRERILKYIGERLEKGEPVNYGFMSRHKYALVLRAKEIFGSYGAMFEELGIDYENEIRADTQKLAELGNEFEDLLEKILIESGRTNFSREPYVQGELHPDFWTEVFWIDAKLTEHTLELSVLEKYTPHCSRLDIVYLVGREGARQYGDWENVRLINVDEILVQNSRNKLEVERLREKYNEILRGGN